jgi:uncharacterized protein YifN (PemK superfamily)
MKRSRQSKPASLGSGQKTSITSWTTPEPGDVISYAYLWHREAAQGQEDGLKDRPSVVVVARTVVNDQLQLLVAPITHSPPPKPDQAVELPQNAKRQLGLDTERSWIVTSELNRFIWPGPDIRLIKSQSGFSPYYGAIPAKLFGEVQERFLALAQQGRIKMVPRTE